MSELKPCPFCGENPAVVHPSNGLMFIGCNHGIEHLGVYVLSKPDTSVLEWNTRPIEDGLQAEIDRLKEKLHDELSQLEIATDLGNKRWLALNDIYKDGEKHNVDWCKRKAQEGLGIR